MGFLLSIVGLSVVYAIMLTMAWIIASQSLYLNHAKTGGRKNTIQNFHDDLKPPVQYIVRRYLTQGRKKSTVRRMVTRISRLVMAVIYLAFLFSFMMQVAIYWQTEQIVNSVLMLAIIILSIWHFIAALQFGQRMIVI